MDAREQRGLVIAALCKLERNGEVWSVPSQSGDGKRYSVDPQRKTCTCPDHQESGFCCKHIHAVTYVMQREVHSDGTVTETKSVTFTEQKKYVQDWPKYNMAQSIEKNRLMTLLADLCAGIEEPAYLGRGRMRVPVRERLFACVMKIYSTVSSRRFACDLEDAKERGYVRRGMHYNQTNVFMQHDDMTDVLQQLIVRTSLPLRAVETNFAVDSSGFSVSRHVRWMDEKYGVERSGRDWVKCHLIVGVKTGIVTAVEIKDRDANDCPLLPELVKRTARNFTIGDVCADKGYLSAENVETIHDYGGTPFIAPKSSTTGAAGGLFEKMVHFYRYRRDEFLNRYHQRSNVESVFSSVKRKFGDNVRSKTDTAMKNEVLCKLICHNLCCVIKSQIELGIEPEFWERANETAVAIAN